jgi:hypothetical protein
MKQKLNNILIAVNTYDGHQYCREDFVKNLKEIQKYSGADVAIFYNGRQMPWGFDGWPIVYYEPSEFDNGISILCAKNNQMRDYFLNGKWSHMLMLESDIIPPIDVVNRLYSYHKDTVTAMYFIKTLMKDMVNMPIESTWNVLDNETMQTKIITIPKGDNIMVIAQKFIPAIWGFFDGKSRIWEMEDAFPQRGLVRIYSAGIGCVLMKRIVLEKCGNFEIRDISEEIQNFTDFLYFKKIHDNGFQAFVDTNTICKHEHYDFDSFVKRRWFDTKTMKPVNDPKI